MISLIIMCNNNVIKFEYMCHYTHDLAGVKKNVSKMFPFYFLFLTTGTFPLGSLDPDNDYATKE